MCRINDHDYHYGITIAWNPYAIPMESPHRASFAQGAELIPNVLDPKALSRQETPWRGLRGFAARCSCVVFVSFWSIQDSSKLKMQMRFKQVMERGMGMEWLQVSPSDSKCGDHEEIMMSMMWCECWEVLSRQPWVMRFWSVADDQQSCEGYVCERHEILGWCECDRCIHYPAHDICTASGCIQQHSATGSRKLIWSGCCHLRKSCFTQLQGCRVGPTYSSLWAKQRFELKYWELTTLWMFIEIR